MDRVRSALGGGSKCIVVHGLPGVGKSSAVREALKGRQWHIGQGGDGEVRHPGADNDAPQPGVTEDHAFVFDPVLAEGFLDGSEPDKAFRRWIEESFNTAGMPEADSFSATTKVTLVVDDAHLWFGSRAGRSGSSSSRHQMQQLVLTLADVVASLPGGGRAMVVLITEDASELHPFVQRCVEEWVGVDISDAEARLKVWRERIFPSVLAEKDHEAELEALNARCHGWVLSDVADLCHSFAADYTLENNENCTFHDADATVSSLLAKLRLAVDKHEPLLFRIGEGGIGGCPWTLIPSHAVTTTWDSIGGLGATKQALQEVVTWPLVHAAELRMLGVDCHPSGVLLYGPPGTGKTLLASAIAKESAANFMTVSISDIVCGHVGESERLLSRVFAMARSVVPCVLFFDEFQALFGRRDGDGAGEVGRKLVSQFLLETDRNPPGLFILAATNVPDAIDPVLLRPGRFDRKIHVPLPDHEGRLVILQRLRARMGSWAQNVNIADLVEATGGFSGAEIDALCQRAALLAVELDKHQILQEHFQEVLQALD